MRSIITRKEPPFLLAILLAAFSWAISHVVTRTVDKPIIEVRSGIKYLIPNDIIPCSDNVIDANQNVELHTFLLTNISKDKLFENLSFLVTTNEGKIHGVRIRAPSPAVPGDKAESCSDAHGSFSDVTLHPGWQLLIDVVTDRKSDLALRLNSAPNAVNLTEFNMETWLVRNESTVLISFLIIITVTAVLYLAYIALQQKKSVPQTEEDESKEGST